MGTIAVVGSINQDLHLEIESLPKPGETVLALGLDRGPGGKGANQAVAVVRSGSRCSLVGAVGSDSVGEVLAEALSTAGVLTDHVHRLPGSTSGTAVVMVDSFGENSIVVASGANMDLSAGQVTASLAAIPDISVVLTQAELSNACIAAAAEFAASTGARFILNLAPYRKVDADILRLCDPLIVNEIESSALATAIGLPGMDHAGRTAALAEHCRSVIITLGGDGAIYGVGSTAGHVSAPEVTVVDTTGAGDAFVGAVAAELDNSRSLADACAAGVAAGSAAVQYRSAQP